MSEQAIEQYNLITKRIGVEWLLLFPEKAFDPTQLAHHVGMVIEELQLQRDYALLGMQMCEDQKHLPALLAMMQSGEISTSSPAPDTAHDAGTPDSGEKRTENSLTVRENGRLSYLKRFVEGSGEHNQTLPEDFELLKKLARLYGY